MEVSRFTSSGTGAQLVLSQEVSMTLNETQMAEAVVEARAIIKSHSHGFLDFNSMVSDDQIHAALTQVLSKVSEPTP